MSGGAAQTGHPWRRGAVVAMALAATAAALGLAGCRGCNTPAADAPLADTAATTPSPAVEAAPAASPTAAAALPAAATAAIYPGPRSESRDGWRITTGFSSEADEPLTAPQAGQPVRIFVTAIDAQSHPVGALERLERGEQHLFVVAKDLRHAVYGVGNGAVREGADARAVTVTLPEGGDHAIVSVFRAAGQPPRVVTAPVTVQGKLPQMMGPGLGSLGREAQSQAERLALSTLPPQPVAGTPLRLFLHDLGADGKPRGEVQPPFVTLLNDQMGWGDVVQWGEGGQASWTPPQAGDYLVLAPPTRGSQALAFRLHVDAPPTTP